MINEKLNNQNDKIEEMFNTCKISFLFIFLFNKKNQSIDMHAICIIIKELYSKKTKTFFFYIRNIPNFVSGIGAFNAALKLSPSTLRDSAGSITPSSQRLALAKYG